MMVLYEITLAPLAEELRVADLGLLSHFYPEHAAFDGPARRIAQLLKLLMRMGMDRGYFPNLAKSLFILDIPRQEKEAKRDFAVEGLPLNCISGSRYLETYLGPQKKF